MAAGDPARFGVRNPSDERPERFLYHERRRDSQRDEESPFQVVGFQVANGGNGIFRIPQIHERKRGNQDSQFKEMVTLLDHFHNSAEEEKALVIFVDGPYYTERRMNELLRFVRDRPPRSYACHIEDVPEILAEYV